MKPIGIPGGLKEEVQVLGEAVEDLLARNRAPRAPGVEKRPPQAERGEGPEPSPDAAEAAELVRRAVARLRELG